MPELSQLKTFTLICELESLAAAARQLSISPAAVSKQLFKLEEELGVQLLLRSTRRLELTDVGLSYYEQALRIMEEVACADALISQVKTEPSGRLLVVSGRHFANVYITPHIKEFLALYQKIELHLELAEHIPDVNGEGIDVLIGMSLPATGAVIQRRIASTSYAFCAAPTYLRQHGTPKNPSDLKNHRYITHSARRPDDVLEFAGHKSLTIQPTLRVNDVQTMQQLAREGLGIIRVHRYVVEDDIKTGALIEVLKAYNAPDVPIYVAFPERRYIPSKSRCFIDFTIAKMQNAHSTLGTMSSK